MDGGSDRVIQAHGDMGFTQEVDAQLIRLPVEV